MGSGVQGLGDIQCRLSEGVSRRLSVKGHEGAYYAAAVFGNQSQAIFELVNRANSVSAAMHIYKSTSSILAAAIHNAFRVEDVQWNRTIWSSDGSELDLANWCSLGFGQVVEAKHLKMMTAFLVEVDIAAKMQIRILLEESVERRGKL